MSDVRAFDLDRISTKIWMGEGKIGERPYGIHPLAVIGGPPESREWMLGDAYHYPEISASALIHAFCTIDGGLKGPTLIGARTFCMARTHIGHDAVIGDDCELGAGVVICGHVTVGDRVRIAGNAFVRPFITIGDDVVIGGGAVVVKNVPAGQTWVGNPARPIGEREYAQVPDGRHGTQSQVGYEDWTKWWDESHKGHHR